MESRRKNEGFILVLLMQFNSMPWGGFKKSVHTIHTEKKQIFEEKKENAYSEYIIWMKPHPPDYAYYEYMYNMDQAPPLTMPIMNIWYGWSPSSLDYFYHEFMIWMKPPPPLTMPIMNIWYGWSPPPLTMPIMNIQGRPIKLLSTLEFKKCNK